MNDDFLLYRQAFGEDNVQIAKHFGNLGRLYQSMKRYNVRKKDLKSNLNSKVYNMIRLASGSNFITQQSLSVLIEINQRLSVLSYAHSWT